MFVLEKEKTLIHKYDICSVNWVYPAKTRNKVREYGYIWVLAAIKKKIEDHESD